jgi:hypothetical protein
MAEFLGFSGPIRWQRECRPKASWRREAHSPQIFFSLGCAERLEWPRFDRTGGIACGPRHEPRHTATSEEVQCVEVITSVLEERAYHAGDDGPAPAGSDWRGRQGANPPHRFMRARTQLPHPLADLATLARNTARLWRRPAGRSRRSQSRPINAESSQIKTLGLNWTPSVIGRRVPRGC